jgi:hypothetical protein
VRSPFKYSLFFEPVSNTSLGSRAYARVPSKQSMNRREVEKVPNLAQILPETRCLRFDAAQRASNKPLCIASDGLDYAGGIELRELQ